MPSEVDKIQRTTADLIKQRMFDEALLYLNDVEESSGRMKPLVEFLRGQIFIAVRDFSRARQHYEMSFENEFRVRSAQMIATLYLAEGDMDRSVDFLEHTIASDMENIKLLKYDLCKFYVISDRYQDAERVMGEILPSMIPPLHQSIVDDAPTFRTAIKAEFENFDRFPNIRKFIDIVQGPSDAKAMGL